MNWRPTARRYIRERQETSICAWLRFNNDFCIFLIFNNIFRFSYALVGIQKKKDTFICANIQVINTILKINRDNRQTLKCINHTSWNLLAFLDGVSVDETNINALVQTIQRSLHSRHKQQKVYGTLHDLEYNSWSIGTSSFKSFQNRTSLQASAIRELSKSRVPSSHE